MRVFAWFLLPALCVAGQELVVQGTVTNGLTHEPLSGVQVRLVQFKSAVANSMEAFGAQSDRAGHFEVGGLKAGRYVVMPTLRGFVYTPPGDAADPRMAMIPIKAGVNQDLKIEMVPHSVITGRVLDADGEPVQRAFVQLERVDDPATGLPGSQSDDRGIFRVVTGPGRYYVKATYFSTPQSEKRTDGSTPFRPAPTYYPASANRDAAVVVEAKAGAEAAGIDVRMGGAGADSRSYGITGIVTGLPENHGDRSPNVMVREKRMTNGGITRGSQVWSDGRFRVAGLGPGEYELFARVDNLYAPPKTVTISNADLTNVELRLTPAVTITGRLVVKGDPPGPLKEKWKVSLQPSDSNFYVQSLSRTVDVAADGSFPLTSVPSQSVRATLTMHPEGTCISSLKFDGAEARPNDVLMFSGRDSSLVVTASRNRATVSGEVKARDGSVLKDGVGFVALVIDAERLDFLTSNRWQVPIGGDGKFEFKSVSPGKYRIVAFEALQSALRSIEDFQKVAARQKEFEVKEGDRLTMDVNVSTREDVNAKP